jgi:hypothetical protein
MKWVQERLEFLGEVLAGEAFHLYIHSFPAKLTPHLFTSTKVMNESKYFILLHGSPLQNTACLGKANFNWWFAQALIRGQTDRQGDHSTNKIGCYICSEVPHCVQGYDSVYSAGYVPKFWGKNSVSICYKIEVKNFYLVLLFLIFYYFVL